MTSELICPSCDREARFREVYGPDDSMHLECTLCGKPTNELELALAQELKCQRCNGNGIVEQSDDPYIDYDTSEMPCKLCGGTGIDATAQDTQGTIQ